MKMKRDRPDRSKQAFEELYDRTARNLLIYLARRMHDTDAANELWAECWAEAFSGWRRCKARSDAEADAWLFGVARNQLASYWRSGQIAERARKSLEWELITLNESDREALDADASLPALRPLLNDALDRLTPVRRAAVELRILKELPYGVVADQLACSEQVARAHVSRGLRQLRRQIDPQQITDITGEIPHE